MILSFLGIALYLASDAMAQQSYYNLKGMHSLVLTEGGALFPLGKPEGKNIKLYSMDGESSRFTIIIVSIWGWGWGFEIHVNDAKTKR